MPIPEHILKHLKNRSFRGKELYIPSCGLNNSDVETLVNLIIDYDPKISSINLSNNIIDSKGAKLLAQIPWLTHINLSYNRVDDRIQELVEVLKRNTALQMLDLSFNQLTDKGVISLFKTSSSNTKREIKIEGNLNISAYLLVLKPPYQISEHSPLPSLQPAQQSSLTNLHRNSNHPGLDMFNDVVVDRIKPPIPSK